MKYSKNGTNPCQCIVRTPDMDDADLAPDSWTYTRGCGATTHRDFAMGHDAKLKSELIDAFRAEKQVAILEADGTLVTRPAIEWARLMEWEHFMTPKPSKRAKATTEAEPEVAPSPGAPVTTSEAIEEASGPSMREEFAAELAENQVSAEPTRSSRRNSRKSA